MARDQIDAFMHAIGAQESSHNPNAVNKRSGAHGTFQIMPSNWAPWSREVFGRVVPKTAANQNAIARHKMLRYYDQFGSWDLVAAAWFGGPGAAARLRKGDRSVLNRSDGAMTIGQYIAKMNRGMGGAGAGVARGRVKGQPLTGDGPLQKQVSRRPFKFDPNKTFRNPFELKDPSEEWSIDDATNQWQTILETISDKIAGRTPTGTRLNRRSASFGPVPEFDGLERLRELYRSFGTHGLSRMEVDEGHYHNDGHDHSTGLPPGLPGRKFLGKDYSKNGRYSPNELVPIGGGHRLRVDAAEQWKFMAAAARAKGINLTITDSYRDYAGQVAVAKKKGLYSKGGKAATPGRSNHGFGLAVDVGGGKQRQWLAQNAGRFGFHTIPREPWHWEYRG